MADTTLAGPSESAEGGVQRKLGTLKAVPRKRSLINNARKLRPVDALAEIIDNSIDNHAKQASLGRDAPELKITILLRNDECTIRETSGGVTPADLQAFVQVGAVGEFVADAPHIGIWGEGQKQAVAALGSDIEIATRYWDARKKYHVDDNVTDQVVIRMTPAWWDQQDEWDIPVYTPERELPRGETLFEIRRLHHKFDPDTIPELRIELANLYGDILAEKKTTITINGEQLLAKARLTPEALNELFAFPPGFEPSRQTFRLEATEPVRGLSDNRPQPRRLRLDVIVGLTPRQEQLHAGVYMFGVPTSSTGSRLGARMFLNGPLQDETVGYTTGPNSILRKHSSLGRLRLYCVFYGDSADIPWGEPGSPVKRGYNSANPFASQIREAIRKAAAPYARYTTEAREIDIVPFSKEWEAMTEAERKVAIRKGAYIHHNDDVEEPEVRDKIKPFMKVKFSPKWYEWDRTASPDSPPKAVPALDEKLSRRAASEVRDRVEVLKKSEDDPAQKVEQLAGFIFRQQERAKGNWVDQGAEDADADADRKVPVTVRLKPSVLKKLVARTKAKTRTEAIERAISVFLRMN